MLNILNFNESAMSVIRLSRKILTSKGFEKIILGITCKGGKDNILIGVANAGDGAMTQMLQRNFMIKEASFGSLEDLNSSR